MLGHLCLGCEGCEKSLVLRSGPPAGHESRGAWKAPWSGAGYNCSEGDFDSNVTITINRFAQGTGTSPHTTFVFYRSDP